MAYKKTGIEIKAVDINPSAVLIANAKLMEKHEIGIECVVANTLDAPKSSMFTLSFWVTHPTKVNRQTVVSGYATKLRDTAPLTAISALRQSKWLQTITSNFAMAQARLRNTNIGLLAYVTDHNYLDGTATVACAMP